MAEKRPAINASPLIFLARAGLLDLLRLVSPELVVPQPVAEEIQRRGQDDPTAKALSAIDWLQIANAPHVPTEILNWDLGPGESSVLAWCLQHRGTEAIIDDLTGRRCAQALRIPVRGSLGLVLLGKKHGRLSSARRVLETMRRPGMYLSDRVLDEALKSVGE